MINLSIKEGLQKEVCLIQVPEGSQVWWLSKHKTTLVIEKYDRSPVVLPDGDWQLIGLCSEVSEDIVNEIVELYYRPYFNQKWSYENYEEQPGILTFDTALKSFQSLLKHHSLNPERTVLLIKK